MRECGKERVFVRGAVGVQFGAIKRVTTKSFFIQVGCKMHDV